MNKLKNLLKKLYKNKYLNIYLIIVLLFALFMSLPFFIGYINGDDTPFHYVNIEERSNSFMALFGKIIPEVGNNFGYGTGLFYPPLPHVLGGFILMIISNFGFQAFGALRILKFIIIFGSALFMYILGCKIFGNKRKGMLTSIIYITSSYFLAGNFVRDSLNESFTFIFVPLIFLGLYYLFVEKKKNLFYLCFIGGYVGMMYSHLVMSVWFTLFLIPVLLLFIKDIFSKSNLISFLISGISILLLTSPFTVPMIEHMVYGNYAIFGERTADGIWTLPIKGFIMRDAYETSSSGQLFINFAPIVIILFILGIFKFIKSKDRFNNKFIFGSLLFLLLGIVFTSWTYIWNFVPSILLSIQFPWRLVGFATFGASIFAVYGLDYLFYIFKKKFIPLASIIILSLLLIFVINNFLVVNFRRHLDTPDVNLGMGWQQEYLPVATVDNHDYYDNRGKGIKVLKGNADVKILENDLPNMKFKVSGIDNEAIVELPRLYYLGYVIKDDEGNSIDYKEDKNGFISLNLKSDGAYVVVYAGTKGYNISIILCFATLLAWMCYGGYIVHLKRKAR